MHTSEVKIRAFEPKYVTITLETPNLLSTVEAEDMALKEFEDQYPEMVDPIVENVISD